MTLKNDNLNQQNAAQGDRQQWERETLEKILFASIQEQRRTRRWKIFFRCFYLMIFIFIAMLYLSLFSGTMHQRHQSHTALIKLQGEIVPNSLSSAEKVTQSLQQAFADEQTKGIILEINSPGGSPVQSDEIYQEIRYLRQKHPSIKLYAVCTDICASGAYYAAAAADAIYVDKASIVGSIGVLMNGFGFVNTMDKLGVQRRLLTAGNHKGFLDPFSALNPNDVKYMQSVLDDVHEQFISSVKQGRGDRLKNDPALFSGLFWSGQMSVKKGLADGIASPAQVARDIIKEPTIVDYTSKPDLLNQFSALAAKSATKIGSELLGLRQSMLY